MGIGKVKAKKLKQINKLEDLTGVYATTIPLDNGDTMNLLIGAEM